MTTSRPACEGIDDDALWFPHPGVAAKAARLAWAEFCGHCPVRDWCLTDAIEHRDEGVRAGTTYLQREAMRRRAARGAPPQPKVAPAATETWTDADLKRAAAAYGRGERTDWVMAGARAYWRRRYLRGPQRAARRPQATRRPAGGAA